MAEKHPQLETVGTQDRLNALVELQMLQDALDTRGPSFLGSGDIIKRVADVTVPLSHQFGARLNSASSSVES